MNFHQKKNENQIHSANRNNPCVSISKNNSSMQNINSCFKSIHNSNGIFCEELEEIINEDPEFKEPLESSIKKHQQNFPFVGKNEIGQRNSSSPKEFSLTREDSSDSLTFNVPHPRTFIKSGKGTSNKRGGSFGSPHSSSPVSIPKNKHQKKNYGYTNNQYQLHYQPPNQLHNYTHHEKFNKKMSDDKYHTNHNSPDSSIYLSRSYSPIGNYKNYRYNYSCSENYDIIEFDTNFDPHSLYPKDDVSRTKLNLPRDETLRMKQNLTRDETSNAKSNLTRDETSNAKSNLTRDETSNAKLYIPRNEDPIGVSDEKKNNMEGSNSSQNTPQNYSQNFRFQQLLDEAKGAGVIPYTYKDGELLLLFQRYIYPRNTKNSGWNDFGGKKEEEDLDAISIASREFSEENACLFYLFEVATENNKKIFNELRILNGYFGEDTLDPWDQLNPDLSLASDTTSGASVVPKDSEVTCEGSTSRYYSFNTFSYSPNIESPIMNFLSSSGANFDFGSPSSSSSPSPSPFSSLSPSPSLCSHSSSENTPIVGSPTANSSEVKYLGVDLSNEITPKISPYGIYSEVPSRSVSSSSFDLLFIEPTELIKKELKTVIPKSSKYYEDILRSNNIPLYVHSKTTYVSYFLKVPFIPSNFFPAGEDLHIDYEDRYKREFKWFTLGELNRLHNKEFHKRLQIMFIKDKINVYKNRGYF
jgi:hypothetical protein